MVDIKIHAGKDAKGSTLKGEKGGWDFVCVVADMKAKGFEKGGRDSVSVVVLCCC